MGNALAQRNSPRGAPEKRADPHEHLRRRIIGVPRERGAAEREIVRNGDAAHGCPPTHRPAGKGFITRSRAAHGPDAQRQAREASKGDKKDDEPAAGRFTFRVRVPEGFTVLARPPFVI